MTETTRPISTGKWCAVPCLVLAGVLAGCGSGGSVTEGGPLTMRRLTESQYRQTIADIFDADIRIVGRFEPDSRRDGLLAVGTSLVSMTPAGFEQYDAMARDIAAQVVDEERRSRLPCAPRAMNAPDDECASRIVAEYGRRLFRRPLAPEELESRVRLAAEATRTLGEFYAGLEYALASLLSSPEFLFRVDRPAASMKSADARPLDAYSKATRLSYFLWNTAPDEELLAAAESGELDTRKGLERQVDRLLASPRLEAGTRAFFADLLRLDAFDELAKDTTIYPLFSAKLMADAREQTLRVIVDHLVTRRGDFRDLFTTRSSFMTRTLGMLYGVPVRSRDDWEPYEFPEDSPRAGLLTQVSFVAMHAHPGRSSPTLRGKFVRETFLCQEVPPPPANVDFTMDAADAHLKTARQRLARHNEDPVCAGCHKLMDPLGLGFEQFDGLGAFRTHEAGMAIDASGELEGVPFEDAVGLGRVMRENPQVSACFVRNVYQYAVGRRVTPGEQPFLEYLERTFAKDGYRWPALLKRIATSDAFHTVSTVDEAPAAPEGPETKTVAVARDDRESDT